MSRDTRLAEHARDLIVRGWTQRADARAADGSSVHPCDESAVRWSLLGALVAAVELVAAIEGERAAVAQLARTCTVLAAIVDTDSLDAWNDAGERTRDDVLAALEEGLLQPGGEEV